MSTFGREDRWKSTYIADRMVGYFHQVLCQGGTVLIARMACRLGQQGHHIGQGHTRSQGHFILCHLGQSGKGVS